MKNWNNHVYRHGICKRTSAAACTMLLCLVMLFGTCLTAFAAADTPSLDFNREGSISVTLYSEEADKLVTDGALTIYEVADLYLDDGNMAYAYTDAWSGCEASLKDPALASLASELAGYAESNGLAGNQTLQVGSDGSVTFTDLKLGLYLIVQTTKSEGYYTVDPFVVTVPMAGEEGWIYNVDASPKVGISPEPVIPEEPTPEEPTPETPVPTEPTLPQTGQLFWPIPILAVCGVLAVLAGWVLLKTDNRRRRGNAA